VGGGPGMVAAHVAPDAEAAQRGAAGLVGVRGGTRPPRATALVDIAVDQGGCFESTRPTTHDDPTFAVAESVFYCVANMPGAVPHTSTYALTNVTLPYVLALAGQGTAAALHADPALARGVNVAGGHVVHAGVAEAHGLPCRDWAEVLG